MSTDEIDLTNVQFTYQKLKASYDGDLDTNALINGASRGLVAAAGDEYTEFLDAEQVKEFDNDLNGSIGGGIGAELYKKGDNVTIAQVLVNTPASKAGLKSEDVIAMVNEENVLGENVDTVVKKIRGEVGTTVKITVVRDGEPKEFSITREIISVPSVDSKTEDGILILQVSRFDEATARLMRGAIYNAKHKGGLKGVVVDLRNNGGGYLDAAVDAAGIWLDNKTVVTEKKGDKVIAQKTTGETAIAADIPTVVLVNQATASASEILAGALRDYKIAKIVGAKTYGKGSVQTMLSLPWDNKLKVTIARWYTPSGVNITKQGIKPDKEVTLEKDSDNQLEVAKGML